MLIVAMGMISVGMSAVLIRMVRSKTVWGKLLSLNLLAIQSVMLIITYAVYIEAPIVIDIALAYSIIGFLSLVLITRLVTRGGNQ